MEEEREIRSTAEHDGEPRDDPPAGESAIARVETAVAPIIEAESVHLPTPAWGVRAADGPVGAEDASPLPPDEPGDAPRPAWLGWVAMLLALATAVLHVVAVGVEADRSHELATILAWAAIGTSLAAVAVGVAAIALGRGRGAGIAAVILGALANPWLVLQVLTVLQG